MFRDLILWQAQTLGEQTIDLRFRLDLPRWVDHLLLDLDVVVPVGIDHIRLFEHRFGREDDVGLPGRIGHELLDHDAEIERTDGLQYCVCLWILSDRIPSLDPQHLERRVGLIRACPCRVAPWKRISAPRRRASPAGKRQQGL